MAEKNNGGLEDDLLSPNPKQPKHPKQNTTSQDDLLQSQTEAQVANDDLLSKSEPAVNTGKHYNYGFSYVIIYKVVLAIVAILVGIVVAIILINILSSNAAVATVIGLMVGALLYYVGAFSVKLFENIAIIAKTSVEIRDALYRKQ